MHELGIVFYIIDDVEEVVEANDLTTVSSVTLELGEVSGVVPSYLDDVWNWAVKKHECMTEAKLKVVETPAVTFCENCGKTYATVKYGRQCPFCQSGKTYLLRGQEINVKEIEAV
ncbi:MAG: hydrogenase maturation nickel metallochaperone HypA [Clostridia bacterium]|nr:hydrogenase maturation nickel metallochaperone HypA [Clostridia bacterium]